MRGLIPIKNLNMKLFKNLFLLAVSAAVSVCANAQQSGIDSTGLPGDNFSLQGALEMFQKAASPEDFEKLINEENNNVNNLDLNGDGDVDYVKVIDKVDKEVHALVLQVSVSETENQDIAVIEIEKTGDENAILQIIGDEDIYGEQVIVEPASEDGGTFNFYGGSTHSGPSADAVQQRNGIVANVWLWPSVRFIYAPAYRPWISPWRWHLYPVWWKPWKPYAWHVWHPRVVVFQRPFVVVRTHRVVRAHAIYKPLRVTSVTVHTRHAASVNHYRVTRTKTTHTGPGGTTIRTTTTVKKNGHLKGKKTTVRRRR